MLRSNIDKEEINKLPIDAFNGEIVVIDNPEKVTYAWRYYVSRK